MYIVFLLSLSFLFFIFLIFIIRFRDAKVCLCRAGGIPWGNSGNETLEIFPFNVFTSWFLRRGLSFIFFFLKVLTMVAFLQSAKKIYESFLGDGVNATALAHIQVRIVSAY